VKSFVFGEVRAERRHKTTKSIPSRRLRCWRKLSRTMRFKRLRSTARRAHFFEIASPRRAEERPLSRARTVKQLSTDLFGFAKTSRKSPGRHSRAWRLKRVLTGFPAIDGRLGRQAHTPLCTACLQDFAPISCGHACAETVGPGSLDAARLKGSLHLWIPKIGSGVPL